ncbi:pyrroline-5-carboxylate reductase [Pseudoroseicyclus tamaricis]|uniref:Pyrroline-5-carboxylate reductase n=1 Tax=Pseudoroseicyclus tamaricis TaxID=2705421 RepID=A0A6B2K0Y2_9RHOB|nr:pyrroline-5-carboxylate reductase [Pseudoroseicyclus tamaricis]NDU99975.1 pyrroline-5-carboxylate reductase [Pseudoroseicyclus tamaricis]
MDIGKIGSRGLVLIGCGKMGSAMLEGWLKSGLPPDSVHVRDPKPSDWLVAQGVRINEALPENPAVALIAVKPQMMGEALPAASALGGGETLVISIAAGTPISAFEAAFGPGTPIVRAMPNTPAAIGRGITAMIGNEAATAEHLDTSETLLSAIGQVVRLEAEAQMDAVTALSGSGPAYVFHLIECMAAAGEVLGLAPEMAMQLAKATVSGAGQLAESADEAPSELRRNVTSPNGTTQAGLEVLMAGLPELVAGTMAAAKLRSEELANG